MTVLFACTHNAGRSQMAAALFDRAAKGNGRALSAGTNPGSALHTVVIDAMREIGIDLSVHQPKPLTPDLLHQADLLVTMGCGEQCPFVPGLRRRDWPLEDPKDKSIEQVRVIRDDIARRVDQLIDELGLRPPD
jgi:arsenate reductase